MGRNTLKLLAVLLVLCAESEWARAESPSEFKEKLKAEWNSLFNKIETARWEERIEYYPGSIGADGQAKPFILHRVDVIQVGNSREVGYFWLEKTEYPMKDTSQGANPKVSLYLGNPKYDAELQRSKEREGWLLAELELEKRDPNRQLRWDDRFPWMWISNIWLGRAINQPRFVFTGVAPAPDQKSVAILRAHFSYDYLADGSAYDESRADILKNATGYVDFDPDHSYRPVACQVKTKSKHVDATYREVWDYEEGDGIPIPKEMTIEGESQKTRGDQTAYSRSKEIHKFSNVRYNGGVSEDEFRMSHYGLPEPMGVDWPKPTPWYLWFIGLGAFCLALGGFFRWRLQRRKSLNPVDVKGGS